MCLGNKNIPEARSNGAVGKSKEDEADTAILEHRQRVL